MNLALYYMIIFLTISGPLFSKKIAVSLEKVRPTQHAVGWHNIEGMEKLLFYGSICRVA